MKGHLGSWLEGKLGEGTCSWQVDEKEEEGQSLTVKQIESYRHKSRNSTPPSQYGMILNSCIVWISFLSMVAWFSPMNLLIFLYLCAFALVWSHNSHTWELTTFKFNQDIRWCLKQFARACARHSTLLSWPLLPTHHLHSMCYTRSGIVLHTITDVATHFSPETFSSIRFTTPLPKTKLANIVKSPAMPVWMKGEECLN